MADPSAYKKPKSVDFDLCFICQLNSGPTDYKTYVAQPGLASVEKLISITVARCSYGESEFSSLKNRLEGLTADELLKNGISYHKSCYKDLTHKQSVDSARTRFEKGQAAGSVTDVRQKRRGRPSSCDAVESTSRSHRSAREQSLEKQRCVLCQEDRAEKLHDVSTKNMGAQLKAIGQETDNENIKVRLSSIVSSSDLLASVAEDMKYHLSCLIKAKRDIEKAKQPQTHEVKFAQILSDMEILDIVETELSDPTSDSVMNMNEVHELYVNLLETNEFPVPEHPRYKVHLKQLILDNIHDVHFNKPLDKTKSEQVLSTKSKQSLIARGLSTEEVKEDLKVLLRAAKILRRDIAGASSWKFRGTFADYKPPALLNMFCKHVIQGTGEFKTTSREESVNQSASVLAQHFIGAYKSDRQVSYQTKNQDGAFKHHVETPLNVGLALDVHKNTRSKSLVEKLGHLDLAASYNKVMEIETGMANAVIEQIESMGGVYQPPWLVHDMFVWFALDNIDFLESTPCGMNTLHGTATAIYQSASDKSPTIPIEIDRSSRGKTLEDAILYDILTCNKPEPKSRKSACELNSLKPSTNLNKGKDLAWVIGCLDFEKNLVEIKANSSCPGTWGAFNSLLSSTGSKTNVALLPPLIRLPPTDYSVLYTGLMRARALTTRVMGPESITVMTLDLQLYDMAMKLWTEREDIRKQFLFRPGELHVLFWALAALGKYIKGSGIDQAWVEAGLYSPTTVTQILNGKHMYRALEAHMVTLLALFNLYFHNFPTLQPDEKAYFKEISACLGEAYQRDVSVDTGKRHNLQDAITKVMTVFESRDIFTKFEQFEGNANKIQHFILNYVKQFETILQFVRATRQRDLPLHMESIESLMKYFFAHDHLNYARLLPLYISTMQETEKKHPEIWAEFMQGNFCVSKGVAGFTSIAPDHGIEQENRSLKVIGGIVGITQNEKSLDKYFLIAPELSKLLHEFEKAYCIVGNDKRTQHHELTGGKLARVVNNAAKLTAVFQEHGDPFATAENEDEIYNLLTKEVMKENVSNDIVTRDDIGQQMFESFVTERLTEGRLSVWDKMTKRKLGTFKSANAMLEVRAGEKLVKIKEERGLLQRFVVISRSRPELDLKDCIGTYEFGVVPRSLFASDGSMLLAYDKAAILHHLESLNTNEVAEAGSSEPSPSGNNLSDNQTMEVRYQVAEAITDRTDVATEATHRVIIIDGMAVVNSVIKTEQMKTCQDFAQSFLDMISNMTANYDEVRLVFDRYINTSLKEQMRTQRTKGKSTYYHVKDSTLIQNISLKVFLSNIKTKAELTDYLADKMLDHSRSPNNRLKNFIVTSGTQSKGNIVVPNTLLTHSQEEADTLLLLHALTVDSEAELVIDSPDTDVLLLMVQMYPSLPVSTNFRTGKGKFKRNIAVRPIFNHLGETRASAILGFHAFTGSDMSGRFAGRSKDWCFKVFMSCDEEIHEAFTSLGNTDPTPDVCSQLERFVCLLYKSKVHTKVNELRWFLYSNRAAEGERLPPTAGSLALHIQRAHYIAMMWKKAAESQPSLPSPTEYGWKFETATSRFTPVLCLNPPAPEAVMNLIKCGCKRECIGRCSCRNNNIPCTEVCGCMVYGCNNKAIDNMSEQMGADDDRND
jgi:hypothetical protein